jgi:hypothetical protein
MSDTLAVLPLGKYALKSEEYAHTQARQLFFTCASLIPGFVVGLITSYVLSHGGIVSHISSTTELIASISAGLVVSAIAILGVSLYHQHAIRKLKKETDMEALWWALADCSPEHYFPENKKEDDFFSNEEVAGQLFIHALKENISDVKYKQFLLFCMHQFSASANKVDGALRILAAADLFRFMKIFYELKAEWALNKQYIEFIEEAIQCPLQKASVENWSKIMHTLDHMYFGNKKISKEVRLAFLRVMAKLNPKKFYLAYKNYNRVASFAFKIAIEGEIFTDRDIFREIRKSYSKDACNGYMAIYLLLCKPEHLENKTLDPKFLIAFYNNQPFFLAVYGKERLAIIDKNVKKKLLKMSDEELQTVINQKGGQEVCKAYGIAMTNRSSILS